MVISVLNYLKSNAPKDYSVPKEKKDCLIILVRLYHWANKKGVFLLEYHDFMLQETKTILISFDIQQDKFLRSLIRGSTPYSSRPLICKVQVTHCLLFVFVCHVVFSLVVDQSIYKNYSLYKNVYKILLVRHCNICRFVYTCTCIYKIVLL